jgi:hypothetical protein
MFCICQSELWEFMWNIRWNQKKSVAFLITGKWQISELRDTHSNGLQMYVSSADMEWTLQLLRLFAFLVFNSFVII